MFGSGITQKRFFPALLYRSIESVYSPTPKGGYDDDLS